MCRGRDIAQIEPGDDAAARVAARGLERAMYGRRGRDCRRQEKEPQESNGQHGGENGRDEVVGFSFRFHGGYNKNVSKGEEQRHDQRDRETQRRWRDERTLLLLLLYVEISG